MSQAKCQVCGTGRDYWTLASVEINCGALRNWKVQACRECVQRIEDACIVALEPPAVATLRARLGEAQVAWLNTAEVSRQNFDRAQVAEGALDVERRETARLTAALRVAQTVPDVPALPEVEVSPLPAARAPSGRVVRRRGKPLGR